MASGSFLAFAAFPWACDEGLPPVTRFVAILLFSAVGGVIPGTLFSLAVPLAPGERTVSSWHQIMPRALAFPLRCLAKIAPTGKHARELQ